MLGRGLEQLRCLNRTLFQPNELPVGCEVMLQVSSFLTCHHAGVDFGDAAVCESFLVLYVTPIKFISSPSWTSVVSILWSIMGLLSGVCRHVSCISRKSFVMQDLLTWQIDQRKFEGKIL